MIVGTVVNFGSVSGEICSGVPCTGTLLGGGGSYTYSWTTFTPSVLAINGPSTYSYVSVKGLAGGYGTATGTVSATYNVEGKQYTCQKSASGTATVQVPTYFTPTGSGSLLNTFCAANQGFYAYVDYQVTDQNQQPIQKSGMTPQESVSQNNGPYTAFGPFSTPQTTGSGGTFEDTPIGTCFSVPPPPNKCIPVAQKFQLVVQGVVGPPFQITTTTSGTDCEEGISITITPGASGSQPTTYTYGTLQ